MGPGWEVGVRLLSIGAFARATRLTPKALPVTKRDLAKLRIHTPQQLRQAPPTGAIADIKVALRSADDGTQFNRVAAFQVIGEGTPPGILEPDADEMDEFSDEGDACDADNFDWREGEQR